MERKNPPFDRRPFLDASTPTSRKDGPPRSFPPGMAIRSPGKRFALLHARPPIDRRARRKMASDDSSFEPDAPGLRSESVLRIRVAKAPLPEGLERTRGEVETAEGSRDGIKAEGGRRALDPRPESRKTIDTRLQGVASRGGKRLEAEVRETETRGGEEASSVAISVGTADRFNDRSLHHARSAEERSPRASGIPRLGIR
ncbi:hypothetical protein KM043_001454 [Ampulex compressa]|nr:hypothetical protein KM043_001454 [Ampulex compressa]